MWFLAALTLASATPPAPAEIVFGGERFGPRQTITCKWFTNFESSRFSACRSGTQALLASDEDASLECLGNTCKSLDEAARKAIGWTKPEAPWGDFSVVFVGRVALVPHAKRYLGDGTRTILIEELRNVAAAK
jgi:hypothetical protein